MWSHAAIIVALAVTAEALGLGGVPIRALTLANNMFTLLLVGLIVVMLTRNVGLK